MKIGELAKQAGCQAETIRYYEKEGLLPPANRDPDNNYRRYDASHLERLTFIRRCRALDMTHEEIRALLTARSDPNSSCESINELINQHLSHVQNKITELRALERQLSELYHSCNAGRTMRECAILHELTQPGDASKFDKPAAASHVGGPHSH